MTDKQYELLLNLYNEFNEAFIALPIHIKDAYYSKLFEKTT